MGFLKKAKKRLGKGMKSVKAPFKKKGRKRKFSAIMSKDFVTIVVIAIIVGGVVAVAALQPDIIFLRPDWAYDTTTTDTTTDTITTTTTTTTITTPPANATKYIFKAQWHLSAPEILPAWVLIEVFTNTGEHRDGIYMFNEDTWYGGYYAYEFEDGFQGYIEARSDTGWSLGLIPLAPKDVSAGPWSNSFDLFNDVGGIVGYLLFTWEVV